LIKVTRDHDTDNMRKRENRLLVVFNEKIVFFWLLSYALIQITSWLFYIGTIRLHCTNLQVCVLYF